MPGLLCPTVLRVLEARTGHSPSSAPWGTSPQFAKCREQPAQVCLVWSAESTWGTSLSDYSSPSYEWERNSRLHSHGCCIRVHWVALSPSPSPHVWADRGTSCWGAQGATSATGATPAGPGHSDWWHWVKQLWVWWKCDCCGVCWPQNVLWLRVSAGQEVAVLGNALCLWRAVLGEALWGHPSAPTAPALPLCSEKRGKKRGREGCCSCPVINSSSACSVFAGVWAREGTAKANGSTRSSMAGVRPPRKRSPGFPGELIKETIKAHDK